MQKKFIVLAVSAALTIPTLAVAKTKNVTIYGQARISLDRVDSGGSAGTGTTQVSSNASYFGLKGSKELDDDLSLIWQIEQVVNTDNSTESTNGYGNTLATRNTFVSLWGSNMGIFALGRYNTPYKITTRYMDVFADTIADNRSLMGGASLNTSNLSGTSAGASFDGNQGDVAAWVSPAFSGFTAAIAYVAGAEKATKASDVKGDAWSTAMLYSNGPLNANVGYEVHNLGTDGTGSLGYGLSLSGLKEEALKLGVSYVMEPFIVYGVYEKTKDNFGGIPAFAKTAGSDYLGHQSLYLAGKYQSGKNVIKMAYTSSGDLEKDGSGSDTGATQWTVGYERSLHRSTKLYVLYTRLNNDANASFNLSSPDGSTGIASASATGASPSAVSLGITHKF